MLRKVITVVLSLCLMLSISAMAEKPEFNIPSDDGVPQRPMSGNFDPSKMPQGDFAPPQNNESANQSPIAPKTDETAKSDGQKSVGSDGVLNQSPNGNFPFGGRMPEGMGGMFGNMQNGQTASQEQPKGFLGFVKTYSTPITSVVLLGLAYIFVIFYKRKHY